MRRRTFVRGVGAGSTVGVAGLAGCLERETDEEEEPAPPDEDEDTLRVATYTSMVTGESPAGTWLAEAFEEEHEDAEIVWTVPEAGIENYVRRAELEAPIDADVYLGLTLGELVYADENLEDDRLFERLQRDRLTNDDRVREDLTFDDPHDRILPFDTGYVTLVADEAELEEEVPDSFEALLESEYDHSLLAQDPRRSDPGLAFLLWTVAEYGDDYLAYWHDLLDNGIRVLDGWTESYREAYLEGERPLVVSYSTDRIGASAAGRELRRHVVSPFDGQGYRNTEGAAVFADTPRTELAYEFVDFVLSRPVQSQIVARNVQFPAVEEEYVDLEERFREHAREPEEAVTFTYDDLHGTVTGLLAEWGDEIG
ncbi:thiamine ABC transporter substrate-binding protein [Natronobacterium texcoconense]|uniref:Thiamine transport system substrate-binding protein n=1 Tax=Natronobacterium texcoconense TaxID=1095778 RepID=A0A1H1HYM1_NATTX|nr:thiamine ABC transporter substrate-binding protein [Natronobacterium texcoconense]SDR30176.1 thiamine transport system substrate-binding protein [Natronobacterium texcoconense]